MRHTENKEKMENKEKIVVVGVSVFFGMGCLKIGRDRNISSLRSEFAFVR